MDYNEFEILISPIRLPRYKISCAHNKKKTRQLYKANIRMSQAFLAILSIFEVVLRNKIDNHYKRQFYPVIGNGEWLLCSTLPGGFLTTTGCRNSLNKVTSVYAELGAAYTHDKLVSELSFGFWKYLFAGRQFMAGGNTLLAIFSNIPAHHNQGNIYAKLDKINALRNRVAHHEPICFGAGNTIGTIYARMHLQEIIDLVTWMNINTTQLFYGLDSVIREADYIDSI